ncbi:MAG: HNH endonuclease [Candidatus Competibacteraceae bacterium]|nr:HNH endonuclease [Candidatus Competibacteraceae bacterium]
MVPLQKSPAPRPGRLAGSQKARHQRRGVFEEMSKASGRGSKWREIRIQVLERDGHTCGYCGGEANQVDHITPLDLGGSNDMNNLIAACARCNQFKSNRVLIRKQFINPRYLPRTRGETNNSQNQNENNTDEETE